jgi:hypothetical protein
MAKALSVETILPLLASAAVEFFGARGEPAKRVGALITVLATAAIDFASYDESASGPVVSVSAVTGLGARSVPGRRPQADDRCSTHHHIAWRLSRTSSVSADQPVTALGCAHRAPRDIARRIGRVTRKP